MYRNPKNIDIQYFSKILQKSHLYKVFVYEKPVLLPWFFPHNSCSISLHNFFSATKSNLVDCHVRPLYSLLLKLLPSSSWPGLQSRWSHHGVGFFGGDSWVRLEQNLWLDTVKLAAFHGNRWVRFVVDIHSIFAMQRFAYTCKHCCCVGVTR